MSDSAVDSNSALKAFARDDLMYDADLLDRLWSVKEYHFQVLNIEPMLIAD